MLSFLLMLAADAAVVAPAVIEPDPKAMSRAEMNAFNARLTRTHPSYIRCERSLETGSLVKKTFSCRTNAQWKSAADTGNDNAREIGEAMRPKFLNAN